MVDEGEFEIAVERGEDGAGHAGRRGEGDFEGAGKAGFALGQFVVSDPLRMPFGELAFGGSDAFFEHLGGEVGRDAPVAVDEGVAGHVGADAVGEPFFVADVGHETACEAAAEGGGADAQGEGIGITIAETGGLAPNH